MFEGQDLKLSTTFMAYQFTMIPVLIYPIEISTTYCRHYKVITNIVVLRPSPNRLNVTPFRCHVTECHLKIQIHLVYSHSKQNSDQV